MMIKKKKTKKNKKKTGKSFKLQYNISTILPYKQF